MLCYACAMFGFDRDEGEVGQAVRQGPWAWLCLRAWWLWDCLTPWRRPTVGAWGERWAARLLKAKGWWLLERNAHPWRHGELDLVMRRGEVILFVEVKTRASEAFGRPLAAIDRRKRERMRRCATHWLVQRGLLAAPHRFDAVEVVGRPGEGVPRMVWVRRLDMSCAPAPDW